SRAHGRDGAVDADRRAGAGPDAGRSRQRRLRGAPDRPGLVRGPGQAGQDGGPAAGAHPPVTEPRGPEPARAAAGQRRRQAGGDASEGDRLRLHRGADEPLHAGDGGLRDPPAQGRGVLRLRGRQRRARLLRDLRRLRPPVPRALPAALPDAGGRAAPDDPGRDDRRPDPDLRLREHDRRRARSMMTPSDPQVGATNSANRPPTKQAGLADPAPTIRFSGEQLAEVRRLQALYPDRRGALLPVLHMAQDTFGWISLQAEEYVAGLFDLSPAHVHEVVTFYTLYFQQPKGRHVVAVCHNLSCYMAGSRDILAHVKRRLGIEVGETTDDGRVTLQSVECLCACEAAPMAQVDERYEMNLTPDKVDRIL